MRETQLGYQATLKRRSATTIYGQDIDEVTLDVELQTNERVRFKVKDVDIYLISECLSESCHKIK